MDDQSPGPYREVSLVSGGTAPFYVIPFGREGNCSAPQTRAHLLAAVRTHDYTDVLLFAHGWNNDWRAAMARYDEFVDGFARIHSSFPMPALAAFRPLLLGVFWPSAALVLPSEREPRFAGAPTTKAERPSDAGDVAAEQVADVAAALPERDRGWFATAIRSDGQVDDDRARYLAQLLAPLTAGTGDEMGLRDSPAAPEVIVAGWRALAAAGPTTDPWDWGTVGSLVTGPRAAGGVAVNLRDVVRAVTVWQMKDRAGAVGRDGVAPLLRDMLVAAPRARFHLVGHSYGAKVMLSAVASGPAPRPVRSLLLLQPAVNQYCFAARVPGGSAQGGYRVVLDRVDRSIFTTYSPHDLPLTRFFHLALRRGTDLGEPAPAPWPTAPSDYAALGGFGPGGADPAWQRTPLKSPGERYTFGPATPRFYALDGTAAIKGHGDINNPSTWWALYCQVTDRENSDVG